ncbi:ankyrin [Dendrothele bispora CBS 962.96]|uniref:Ankyrin n=1 Tax=Dendrothele bispora (strain CBS 962.96) TaxID=1314807 RepID=A0A4S8MGK2_DENBC|nr:ankyrin [Dendrothele bispora CBS 962.96]
MSTISERFTLACTNDSVDEIRLILADCTTTASALQDHPLQEGLTVAAQNGNSTIVKYLLGNGFIMSPDAIIAASKSQSVEVFQAMIDSGWNINQSAGHTGDALSHAVAADRTMLTKWLLEHGANPNENYRSETWTCLDLGVIHASPQTVELLLEHGANKQNANSLILASFYGRIDMIDLLLDHGVDIDEIPDNDLTHDSQREKGLGNALHIGAREGREDVVRCLLRRGADKAITDSLHRTATDLAKMNGHGAVVELLQDTEDMV